MIHKAAAHPGQASCFAIYTVGPSSCNPPPVVRHERASLRCELESKRDGRIRRQHLNAIELPQLAQQWARHAVDGANNRCVADHDDVAGEAASVCDGQ